MSVERGWIERSVGECCDILDHRRIPVSTEERARRKGEVPYYGANGQQGTIDGYIFDEELILLAEDGGDFDNYATKPIAYRISGKSWVNNHAHVLRVKEGYNFSFIFNSIAYKDIRFYIRGGTRSKLNKGELTKVRLCIPADVDEQRTIATILDSIDNAIRHTKQMIEKLQRVKVGLLHDLLTYGLDENGELRDPIRHPEEFKDSPLGRIPKEWDIYTAEEISTQITDGEHQTPRRSKDGIYLLSARNILDSRLALEDVDFIDEKEYQRISRRCTAEEEDILISCSGSIGRVCLVPPDFRCTMVRSVAIIKLKKELASSGYVEVLFQSPLIQQQIASGQRQLAQANLFQGEIKRLVFPVPPIEEQAAISLQANAMNHLFTSEVAELTKLKQLKQGLTRDLLTGKVPVT